jgi:hypothetical protein
MIGNSLKKSPLTLDLNLTLKHYTPQWDKSHGTCILYYSVYIFLHEECKLL